MYNDHFEISQLYSSSHPGPSWSTPNHYNIVFHVMQSVLTLIQTNWDLKQTEGSLREARAYASSRTLCDHENPTHENPMEKLYVYNRALWF